MFSYGILCKTFYFVQNTSNVNSVHSCLIRDNNHIQIDVKGKNLAWDCYMRDEDCLCFFFFFF